MDNNDNKIKKYLCHKCGRPIDTEGVCPDCESILKKDLLPVEDIIVPKPKTKPFATILTIIAGLNITAVGSILLPFLGIWFLFGAFGETSQYFGIIFFCLSYILASVVFLILAIRNGSRGGIESKNVIVYTIASFVIALLGFNLVYYSHEIFSDHSNIQRGVVLYETSSDIIYQESVIKDDKKVKIKLRYDSKENSFSNVPFIRDKIKVNDKIVPCKEHSDDYYGTVRYYEIQNEDLEKAGITEITSISFLKYIGEDTYDEYEEYSEYQFEEVQIKFK